MLGFLEGRIVIVRIVLLAAVLTLVAIGIAAIYSVGNPAESSQAQTEELSGYWKKQALFAAVGWLAFIAANIVSYRLLGRASYWLYAFVLILLGILLLDKVVDIGFVPVINGTRRWIKFQLGPWEMPALQPSELCKLAYVMALAWYLRFRSNYRHFNSLIGPFALTLLPMLLILLEPNLGTVLLLIPVLFTMLFIAGARVKHLMLIILLALLVSPFLWHFMEPYQRTRISSVILQTRWMQQKAEQFPKLGSILVGREFNTRRWKNDWGYHLIRSKYAVASGGMNGNGFRRGTFIKYNFLPERHNDFIFAVIAHQWGFVGCAAVLLLYAIIVWCAMEIAINNTDPFGRLLAVGIIATFTVEILVNVSMTLGLMPITGLTLPFVSYGGSSLVVSMTAVGLLNNIGRYRRFTVAPKSFEN